MDIDSKTRLLGLFGNPSKHSFSPIIQNHFLSNYKINCVYLTFEPAKDNLRQALESAKNLNFIGLNITMPFKEEICRLVDKTLGAAAIIKAINTIKFLEEEKTAIGFSTDGDGVIKSLEDKKFSWYGKNCLILGAGGAAKSAVYSILQKNVSKIFIYDIVEEKLQQLIKIFKYNLDKNSGNDKNIPETKGKLKSINIKKQIRKKGVDEKIIVLADLRDIESSFDSIDLIMNCTPVGMDAGNNKDLIPVLEYWNLKNKFIFDMVYKPVETKFLKKAKKEGASEIINGVDMLVNQAVYSFKIWFDIMPEEKIIKQVKEKILKDYLLKY